MDLYAAVGRRAHVFLSEMAQEFQVFNSPSQKDDCFCFSDVKLGAPVRNLKLAQCAINRIFGRIYSCRWSWEVPADLGDKSQIAKLTFKGWRKSGRSAIFKSRTLCPLLDVLNACEDLLDLCRALELIRLEVAYSPELKVCEIRILPSYGEYIWLMIPPVKYSRKPNEAEVNATAILVACISKILCVSKKESYYS